MKDPNLNKLVDQAYRYYYDNFSNDIHAKNYKQLVKLLKTL